MKIPSSWSVIPVTTVGQKYPASKSRPEKAPMKKQRKVWTVPIQDMTEADSPRFRV